MSVQGIVNVSFQPWFCLTTGWYKRTSFFIVKDQCDWGIILESICRCRKEGVMSYFGTFYLDKEKDVIVHLNMEKGELHYLLETPNHHTGNLITNLARLCGLPLSYNKDGMKIIEGIVPSYTDGNNHEVYIFRLSNTKTANIYPDGRIEMKASLPAIAKTLMSQTKDYHLSFEQTLIKSYIFTDCKFHSDLHTHMNANLTPDLLIALGIFHQIDYPFYYIKKLGLKLTEKQVEELQKKRQKVIDAMPALDLKGKYLERWINDRTLINFADLILNNMDNAAYNISAIRQSLAIMKDGQAVFSNLEKVYIYRYVFTKGVSTQKKIRLHSFDKVPDRDISAALFQMAEDRQNPAYQNFSLFQNKLLWVARSYQKTGVKYAEISDTTLVKRAKAAQFLKEVHECMPAITKETGVLLRFLAAIRRVPVTMGPDPAAGAVNLQENLQVLKAAAGDPYVAGVDIVGEEVNDIRDFALPIKEIVHIARDIPSFVVRIHAGENDCLRDNVSNSIHCIIDGLEPDQPVPMIRIGHGLYTANLKTAKGKQLIRDILQYHVVLEFQITSNVRLNNLSALQDHPLKQYLAAGIACVQGSDGGALYGTDSIDEQLALERMLRLTHEEMKQMRHAEDHIIDVSEKAFEEKKAVYEKEIGKQDVSAYYTAKIKAENQTLSGFEVRTDLLDSKTALAGKLADMPAEKVPVVIGGGSFNNDSHVTRMTKENCALLDFLLQAGDPEKMFFVIGNSLKGYEKYLLEKNRGKFEIFAIVPSVITKAEEKKLNQAPVKVKVSIEPYGMGLYKSFSYEVFKRMPSVLIAFDGNTAGMNLIQEAKNGRHKCIIFVNEKAKMLRMKAQSLRGYVHLFSDDYFVREDIMHAIEDQYCKMGEQQNKS